MTENLPYGAKNVTKNLLEVKDAKKNTSSHFRTSGLLGAVTSEYLKAFQEIEESS